MGARWTTEAAPGVEFQERAAVPECSWCWCAIGQPRYPSSWPPPALALAQALALALAMALAVAHALAQKLAYALALALELDLTRAPTLV